MSAERGPYPSGVPGREALFRACPAALTGHGPDPSRDSFILMSGVELHKQMVRNFFSIWRTPVCESA